MPANIKIELRKLAATNTLAYNTAFLIGCIKSWIKVFLSLARFSSSMDVC
jgi:hypothetical protein